MSCAGPGGGRAEDIDDLDGSLPSQHIPWFCVTTEGPLGGLFLLRGFVFLDLSMSCLFRKLEVAVQVFYCLMLCFSLVIHSC